MTTPAHPDDRLVDFVDGRLDDAEASAIRAHVDACDTCRAVRDDLVAARRAAASLRDEDVPMPADLLASVSRALDAEARPVPVSTSERPVRVHPALRGLVAALAAAAVVMLYLQIGSRPPALDLPAQVARDLGAVGSRSLPLALESSDAAALERYFAASPGPRVRVIDLAMMNIVLEGGARHAVGGHPSVLYSYRLPSAARLVCQMYQGRLADLPPPGEVRDAKGFRFQVYSRGAVTLVFWQEGDLVCVLAAALPTADVIALAEAKAMSPA